MAGSPLYTNKDADRQYWMGGPWTEKNADNTGAPVYDDAQAARERATADLALASAKDFLGKRTVVDDANDAATKAQQESAWQREQFNQTVPGYLANFGKGVNESPTARAALKIGGGALGAALTGGTGILLPAAMSALGTVLGDATGNAVGGKGFDDMSAGQVAGDVAEGALPFVAGRGISLAGKALEGSSNIIPASVRRLMELGGVFSGHPGALAAEAAAPVGRGMQAAGQGVENAALGGRNALREFLAKLTGTAEKKAVAPVFERYGANTSGFRPGPVGEAPSEFTGSMGPQAERYAPNTSGFTPGPVREAPGQAIEGLNSAIDRHMTNTSGFKPGPVGEAPGQVMPGQFQPPTPKVAPKGGMDPLVDRYMPNVSGHAPSMEVLGEEAGPAVNGSGESAASQEAINRLSGMKARGEQFGVFDRAGKFRPLVGADAVDYVPAKGETFGTMKSTGFQVLNDNGGRVVQPMGASGDEYAGVKQAITEATKRGETGGAFNRNLTTLSPEEEAAASGFSDDELNNMIQGLLRATGK